MEILKFTVLSAHIDGDKIRAMIQADGGSATRILLHPVFPVQGPPDAHDAAHDEVLRYLDIA